MPKQTTVTTIFNHTFKHAKKLSKNFYFKKWAKHPPQCPAFKGEFVHIGREGWEHILDSRRRSKMDVLGRLFSLEAASTYWNQPPHFRTTKRQRSENIGFLRQ